MRDERKKPKSDLRKYYSVFLELGIVVTMLIFIVAMKVDIRAGEKNVDYTVEQEVVQMKEVIQTEQEKVPPPPPTPQVPVAVPNDEVIQDQVINIDADLDLSEPLQMPDQPPQQNTGPEENFFVAVEQMPQLKGGLAGLQSKIEYPERCRRAGIEGRVIIQFIVTEEGTVKNAHITRGIGGGCDEEALRVVKEAQFVPGRQRGRPVPVQYSLPITFRLQN